MHRVDAPHPAAHPLLTREWMKALSKEEVTGSGRLPSPPLLEARKPHRMVAMRWAHTEAPLRECCETERRLRRLARKIATRRDERAPLCDAAAVLLLQGGVEGRDTPPQHRSLVRGQAHDREAVGTQRGDRPVGG
eukprot:CAMPEP_0195621576 /NCGR_PEP_ID=MMETSP0815-20121206/15755_1 /TAXON_ID=97485 /ORGANISM="Prymnesium parvum, Strain Texoma1" /LENGTH=134 /DNA_ID=CAMNT_0040762319 /DNA_START=482 /DNA_END=883 /DNA_ORIENTATION=-